MNKDYQITEDHYLVGQRFAVDEVIYIVQHLTVRQNHTVVQAQSQSDGAMTRRFFLTEVLERLLVDEEIVLFSPNYLGAR